MLDDMRERVRRSLPFVMIAAVLGILLGLLLGWRVWPVTWYNTDPSDLRVEHQKTWLLMAADSLAQTGNVEIAQIRLAELQDEDTSWEQVANLVERVAKEQENAGDLGSALLVQRMAQALQMPWPSSSQFQEPRARIRFSDNPLLLPFIAVLVVLMIAAALWLLITEGRRTGMVASSPRRVTPTSMARPRPTPEASRTADSTPSLVSRATTPAAPVVQVQADELKMEKAEEPGEMEPTVLEDHAIAQDQQGAVSEAPIAAGIPVELPEEESVESVELEEYMEEEEEEAKEDEKETLSRAHVQRQVASSELPPDALGVWEADYAYGDDDFDCNFTIETPNQEFLGECGVGAANFAVGDGPQKVDAFEIWLFDKGDIRTVRQVLVSEYAYNDAALSTRLAEKGEVIVAQPGAIITLETLSLAVTATVQEMAYTQDEEKENAYFERLRIEMVAEKNDQLP